MQLQLIIRDTTGCFQKTFGIQVPLGWVTDSCCTYGQAGVVIRLGVQGERQASLVRLRTTADAWSINESRLGLSHYITQRCIMPVSSFRIIIKGKWHDVQLKDRSYMCCAGIWETWQNAVGVQQEGVVLMLTRANVLLAPFQKMMPFLLHLSELDIWLQSKRPLTQDLQRLASPYPSELMYIISLS